MASLANKGRYNHLFPKTHKRQFCYESLCVASSSQIRSDGGASIAASTRFLAYPDVSGGGSAVAILPITSYGRRHVPTTAATYQQPLFKLHSSKVHCVDFAPHDKDKTVLASGASDGTLHVYEVPKDGLVEDVTTGASGVSTCSTGSAVYGVRFHPTANTIALVHHPKSIDVWDCSTQQRVFETSATDHMQSVYSATWSFDGKTFISTCKDKIIRLFDSRSGNCEATTMGHGSWRPSISMWLDRGSTFLTTGHGSDMSREVMVWDSRSLSKHISKKRVDSGSSVLMPLADTDTGLIYLTSRGDTSLRVWHFKGSNSGNSSLQPIKEIVNSRLEGDPVLDTCLLPKAACDVKGCEMARILRLTQKSIDPVRIELPRRDKSRIDEEIFADTCARLSSAPMSASEFISGEIEMASPPLVSVKEAVASVQSSGGGSQGPQKMVAAASGSSGESKESGSHDNNKSKNSQDFEEISAEDTAAEARRKRASAAFSNQSKFKYIRLEAPGERNVQKTWFNLKVNTSASDAMPISASKSRFAVPWKSVGGGPIFVGRIDKPGKAASGNDVPLLTGHKERVMSIQFNPFDEQIMASGSDDADVRIWRFDGADVNNAQCQGVFGGHIRGVRNLLWNPVAKDVLASASSDNSVKIWNCSNAGGEKSPESLVTSNFEEAPMSLSWNYDGSSLAVAGRKTVFIVDPRVSGEIQSSIQNTHDGSKGQRIVWLRDANRMFTVGSTKSAAREFKLWDMRKADSPVITTAIDRGAAVYNPLYDEDVDIMYLAAKGEQSIHAYDLSNPSKVRVCDRLAVPGNPMCGLCFLPKKMCNVQQKQVVTALHCSSTTVQPISIKVPRAASLSKYFHDDLFPATRDFDVAPMTADQFFDASAKMAEPVLVSLRPNNMPLLSEKPVDTVKKSSKPEASSLIKAERAEAERKKAKEASFNRLGALANQYAKYNTNKSMGSRKIKGERERVAARKVDKIDDDSDDSGWTDSDEDEE